MKKSSLLIAVVLVCIQLFAKERIRNYTVVKQLPATVKPANDEEVTQKILSKMAKKEIKRFYSLRDPNEDTAWVDTISKTEYVYTATPGKPLQSIAYTYKSGAQARRYTTTQFHKLYHHPFKNPFSNVMYFGLDEKVDTFNGTAWVPYQHQTVALDSFDGNKHLIKTIAIQKHDGTSYKDYVKNNYEYNNRGFATGFYFEQFISGKWETNNGTRKKYTTDANWNVTNCTVSGYYQKWFEYTKEDYFYDSTNTLTNVMVWDYDGSGGFDPYDSFAEMKWISIRPYSHYIYDQNNPLQMGGTKVASFIKYEYNPGAKQFILAYKVTNTYNADSQITVNIQQTWTGSAWSNYEKHEYEYYPNGDFKSEKIYAGNGANWALQIMYIEENEYDADGDMLSTVTFQQTGSQKQYGDKLFIEYNTFTSLPQTKANSLEVKLFPNPAHNILNIKANESGVIMNIYNLDGKLVNSSTLNNGMNTLNINTLESGFYLAKLQSANGLQTLRFQKM